MGSTSNKLEHAERVNGLLARWRSGDKGAYNELITALHADLSVIAHRHFQGERADHTLETNDLVSKLYLKLLGSKTIPWTDYVHFLRSSARTMRQILIDHSRGWEKRATGKDGVPLPDPGQKAGELPDALDDGQIYRLVQLDQALEKMEQDDPLMARIADLRLVLGLTLEEVAHFLKIPINKAKREWLIIKKLLAESL